MRCFVAVAAHNWPERKALVFSLSPKGKRKGPGTEKTANEGKTLEKSGAIE